MSRWCSTITTLTMPLMPFLEWSEVIRTRYFIYLPYFSIQSSAASYVRAVVVLDTHPLPVRGQSCIRYRPDTGGGQ